MQDWFRNERGWLLVLDNVDEIETLALISRVITTDGCS